MIRFLFTLCLWGYLCALALHDAGVPYQCTTDTQCEALHGADVYIDDPDGFEEGLRT